MQLWTLRIGRSASPFERKEDERTGVGPARLSALSVLVFAEPMRLTRLARIEQVKPPTMTKVIAGLEAAGLVRRRADAEDGRAVRLEATPHGTKLLQEGRRRSVSLLGKSMSSRAPPLLSSACQQLSELRQRRSLGLLPKITYRDLIGARLDMVRRVASRGQHAPCSTSATDGTLDRPAGRSIMTTRV
jgi:DNA-binding MarR family transcriptional regulator